jgi:hypothetical protein
MRDERDSTQSHPLGAILILETISNVPTPIELPSFTSHEGNGSSFRNVLSAHFPYFEKVKVGIWDHFYVCVFMYLYLYPLLTTFE